MRLATAIFCLMLTGAIGAAAGASTIRGFAPLASGASPHDAAVGRDGQVYFTEPAANRIGVLNPVSGQVKEFTVPTRDAFPGAITLGPGPWLSFTERRAGKIGQFLPATHVFREFPLPQRIDPDMPLAIGQTVYFTARDADAIGALDPGSGMTTMFAVPTAAAAPTGIVAGSDRALYFCETDAGSLGRFDLLTHRFLEYPIPSTGAQPRRLTAAGNRLYFTEYRAGRLAAFDLATKHFREWDLPGGRAARPGGIAVDRAGMVWLAERTGLVNFDPVTGRFQTLAFPWSLPDDRSAADPITIGSHALAENGDLWIALPGARRLAVVIAR